MSITSSVSHLRSLTTTREQCTKVFKLAESSKTEYFTYNPAKEGDVVEYAADIIKRDFGDDYSKIPPHGRWRHFDFGGQVRLIPMISRWAQPSPDSPSVPPMEITRRLVDLFVVSVLLDAGAGAKWSYEEKSTGLRFGRSEGLAVASLDMFKGGLFSSDENVLERVDSKGLANLDPSVLATAMQVEPEANPMTGIDGRATLLVNLASALEARADFFGGADPQRNGFRPGNLIDYLASHPSGKKSASGELILPISALWEVLLVGLAPIWPPSRTMLDGVSLGDVWPCDSLSKSLGVPNGSKESLVPFHKLSQWMTYSVVEPIEKVMGWKFEGMNDMTGLPEYRNGGLFVDLGVLTPTTALLSASLEAASPVPVLEPSHPAIIEWRALTVILLDRLAERIRAKLGAPNLTLPQILESASWKGGREIARKKREDGGPPIEIRSDGTVF